MEQVEHPQQRPTFDQQFSEKKELQNPAGSMKYVQIESAFPSPVEQPPLLFFPGWSITLATEKPLLRGLSEGRPEVKDEEEKVVAKNLYGRTIVSGEFPRHGGEVSGREGIADEIVRQAELMSGLLLQQDVKADLVVDSMAAMGIIAAMKLNPEILDKINNLLIVSPAGISGDDNLIRLVGRSLAHFTQDGMTFLKSPIEKRNIIRMGIEAALYVGKNPKRTVKEINAIAQSEQYGALKDLKSQLDEKGIMLGFMQGEDDKLTPAKKLWAKIGEDTHSVWKELSQSEYDDEPEYAKRGIEVGNTVWDRGVQNEKPPFDMLTLVGGGHDNRLYANSSYSTKILSALEELNQLHDN